MPQNGHRPRLEEFQEALLRIGHGDPELVIVDARILRLLMPGIAELLILEKFEVGPGHLAIGEERFAWDDDPLCP